MTPRSRAIGTLAAALLGAAAVVTSSHRSETGALPGADERALTLDDYRHFRALSVDLRGRMPTREEVAAFERGMDLDRFVDEELAEGAHAARLSQAYMDLLRLEVSPSLQYLPWYTVLRRVKLLGPDKKETWVYFRRSQRRRKPEIDGEFCFTKAETGMDVKMDRQAVIDGKPIPVDAKVWEERTVVVKPWWLYADEDKADPSQLLGEAWRPADGYRPIDGLTKEPDGSRTRAIRICREEASDGEIGNIFVAGRDAPIPAEKLGRQGPAPADTLYARQHGGEAVSCRSSAGLSLAPNCGCGVGLWACLPGDSNDKDLNGFVLPGRAPLGMDLPFDEGPKGYSQWHKTWWNEEVRRIFERVFKEDRDFREVVTGRWTVVNGPLAQFYRSTAPTAAGGPAKLFAVMGATEPLVRPDSIPRDVSPHDVGSWRVVQDRGPLSAGVATTPAFLLKYASRRARAATLYTAFLCKAFSTDTTPLTPSSEPDLRKRAGCASCHAALEPLAAYFARVQEADFTVLSPTAFPVDNAKCRPDAEGKINRYCGAYYDPAFTDAKQALLRGAYGAPSHVDLGPSGAAAEIAASPDFATCAVSRVAAAFLGRPLGAEDAKLAEELHTVFVQSGYRMRPLVRAVLRSEAYAKSTPWNGTLLRGAPPPPDIHASHPEDSLSRDGGPPVDAGPGGAE